MPQLLSDSTSLAWQRHLPQDEAINLINHVNEAAANGVKRPVELVPHVQHDQVHGLHVLFLGRLWLSVRFLEAQALDSTEPAWVLALLQAPAVIRCAGTSPSDRIGSLDHLVVDLWESNLALLDYVAWAFYVVSERTTQINAVSLEPIVRALEALLPPEVLRTRFSQALIGETMAALLDALKTTCSEFKRLGLIALQHVKQASRLWHAIHDNSLRTLLPFLLQALPHVQPPLEMNISKWLGRIGVGRGLAKRLCVLPPSSQDALVEVCGHFQDLTFTRMVMRRLAPVMARLDSTGEQHNPTTLGMIFELCQRLALLDQHLSSGSTHLSRRLVARLDMARPVIDAQTHLAASQEDPHPTPIRSLCHALEAALTATLAARSSIEMQRIHHRMTHVLDWLAAEGGLTDDIPSGISLDRLNERANAWSLTLHLKELPDWRWNCALLEQADLWAEREARFICDFRIEPLVTAVQLVHEGRTQGHCVGSYAERCASGHTRIFSIQQGGQPYATTELAFQRGHWQLVQCKGKHNEELLEPAMLQRTPLAEALRVLTVFYNDHAPQAYPSVMPSGDDEPKEASLFDLTPEFLAEARAQLPFIGNFLRELEI